MILLRTGFLMLCAAALAGCSILPAAGPTAREVEKPATENAEAGAGFVVVDIDDPVIEILSHAPTDTFVGSFTNRRPAADLRIGVGDVLQIAIWEAGGSGLFGPAAAPSGAPGAATGAHAAPLQPTTVGRDGMISVPFAGRIRAAGRTPDEVRAQIENALKDKAIQPQVMVTVSSNASNVATVGGEVFRSGAIPLTARGDRLLDVIAAAGGARFPAYETFVRLSRRGHGATVLLQRIVDSAAENIYVQPGDDVYVSRNPRSFTAFGAAGKVGQFAFESPTLTLAEGVARSGGPIDAIGDPAGVFLFRYETIPVARRLRPDLQFSGAGRAPVVYKLNLREANGYFRAQSFRMRDKDVILVANADGAQLLKFFTLLRGVSGIISDIRSTAQVRSP